MVPLVPFLGRPSGASPVFTALGQGKVAEDPSHSLEETIKRLTPLPFHGHCINAAKALVQKVLTEAVRGNATPSLRAVEDLDSFVGHKLEPAAVDVPRDLFDFIERNKNDHETIIRLGKILLVFFRALLAKKLSDNEKMTPKAKGKILPQVCKDYGVSLEDILPKTAPPARIPPSGKSRSDYDYPPPNAPAWNQRAGSSGLTKAPAKSSASAPKSPSKAKVEREKIATALREEKRAAAKEKVKAPPVVAPEPESEDESEDEAMEPAEPVAEPESKSPAPESPVPEEGGEEEEDESDGEMDSNVVGDTDDSDSDSDSEEDEEEEGEGDLAKQIQALIRKDRARAKPSKADKEKISQLEGKINTLEHHLDIARAAKKVAEERCEKAKRAAKEAEQRAVEAEQRAEFAEGERDAVCRKNNEAVRILIQ